MISGLGPKQVLLIPQGLKWTLLLSGIAFVGGGLGGSAIALCRTSRWRWLRVVAIGFIEIFRGTPVLLQLFMVYYGLALLDFPLDPWIAVAIGFTLNASAFLGDLARQHRNRASRTGRGGPSARPALLGARATVLHRSSRGRSWAISSHVYGRRTYSGRPSSSIWFSTFTAIAISVARR